MHNKLNVYRVILLNIASLCRYALPILHAELVRVLCASNLLCSVIESYGGAGCIKEYFQTLGIFFNQSFGLHRQFAACPLKIVERNRR